jgi:hypothetical protein
MSRVTQTRLLRRPCLGVVWLLWGFQAAALAQEAVSGSGTLRLGDCEIFVSPSRRTFIARKGTELYYGTLAIVTRATQGEKTGYSPEGKLLLAFYEVERAGVKGLVVRCDTQQILYSQMAETAWQQLPNGRDTSVPVCPDAGAEHSQQRIPDPCQMEAPAVAAPRAELLAWEVSAVEGEVVPADEIHIMLYSRLIEEGQAVALMSQLPQNIQQARQNINGYIAGYFLAVEQVDGRYRFSGPTKAFRTTAPGRVSVWPPILYPDSRREALRRARSPVPVRPSQECPEMYNLRLYVYPITVGHDGQKYVTEPSVLAFFVDPKTGRRMTVFYYRDKCYGAVSPMPLQVTSQMFIAAVRQASVGPLGLGTAYVPTIFYSREVQIHHQPFPPDSAFYRLLPPVLGAAGDTVDVKHFQAIAREMSRYTGGGLL